MPTSPMSKSSSNGTAGQCQRISTARGSSPRSISVVSGSAAPDNRIEPTDLHRCWWSDRSGPDRVSWRAVSAYLHLAVDRDDLIVVPRRRRHATPRAVVREERAGELIGLLHVLAGGARGQHDDAFAGELGHRRERDRRRGRAALDARDRSGSTRVDDEDPDVGGRSADERLELAHEPRVSDSRWGRECATRALEVARERSLIWFEGSPSPGSAGSMRGAPRRRRRSRTSSKGSTCFARRAWS